MLVLDSVLLTIIACVLVADFITGLIHWWEDTYGLPSWPVLGKLVIEPNIEHHQHPGWIGSMSSLISRNYQTVVPSLLIMAGITWIWGWMWPVMLTLLLASLGNEVHTWNHRKKNNFLITFLQDACIIQTPRQHALHHRAPYDRYFCTLTNVTNAILDHKYINFWRRLEWTIHFVFRIPIKRMSDERNNV